MEVTRKNLREVLLETYRTLKTCDQAKRLCSFLRHNRVILEPKDVQEICAHIADLCNTFGCKKPSDLCFKAIKALSEKDEMKYLDICTQSSLACTKGSTQVTYVV